MKQNARTMALKALMQIENGEGYSNLVLAAALRSSGLTGRDAALAATLVYGVLERRITLDAVIAAHASVKLKKISPLLLEILRIGVYQLYYCDKIPPSAAVDEAVRCAKAFGQGRSAGFVNGVLRAAERAGREIPLQPGLQQAERLSILYSCPAWIIRLWQKAYGEESCLRLLEASFGRPPLTARVNPLKNTEEELCRRLEAEGAAAARHPFVPGALELQVSGGVEGLAAFKQGCFHIQDAAAQLCALLVGAQPGETIADVCAAPGGKSFTMAQQMQDKGRLLAFDSHAPRVGLIEEGAKRLGLSIIRARVRDAAAAPADFTADRVLCDVPCFGLGILRRKPEIRYKPPAGLDNLPGVQYCILVRSSLLVKNGGVLVYSTCSLNPAENGEVARRFLHENPGFCPLPLHLPKGMPKLPGEAENEATLMPHLHQTDGFYIAAFQKK